RRDPNTITFIACLPPQAFGNCQWFDLSVCPKCFLTSPAMQLAMVSAAKRHSKFIADLQTQTPTLGETDMMSIARLLCADDTRLLCDKFPVLLVTHAPRFRQHTAPSVFVRDVRLVVTRPIDICRGVDRGRLWCGSLFLCRRDVRLRVR